MNRPSTALGEIGVFGLVTAGVSVFATLAVGLALPEPKIPQMTVGEAVAVLRGDPDGKISSKSLARRIDGQPLGLRAPLIETLAAAALDADRGDVRAVWTISAQTTPRPPASFTLQVRRASAGNQDPERLPTRLVIGPADLAHTTLEPEAQAFLLEVPQAPFRIGLRRADGRWWIAETPTPFWSGWRLRMLMAFAACFMILGPMTWLFAGRITRPLRHLVGRATAPLPVTDAAFGPREVRAVAEAIDSMRDRLASEASDRVRMVAAVAHDLRTPLTSIRLRAERASPVVRERIVDDVVRMEEMIDRVLDFARSDVLLREMVSLRSLALQRVQRADGRDGCVLLAPGPDVCADVDPLQIDRALDNLIQNALFYAGDAVVAVTSTSEHAVLTVSDSGPGIAPSDRERFLEPFVRSEVSRNRHSGGMGLGLSVVNDIVRRHGGLFALLETPGGGVRAEVHLPIGGKEKPSGLGLYGGRGE